MLVRVRMRGRPRRSPQAPSLVSAIVVMALSAAPAAADDVDPRPGDASGHSVTLTPRAATNQVGTQHTVTATVRNQAGQPVQGFNVDFSITQGPNAGLSQAGMTDAVTNVNGQATFTYSSNATGTDTILACSETGGSENDQCNLGEPRDDATKTWQTAPVTIARVDLDMQARVQDGAGADTATDDCEVTTPNNASREKTATNSINETQASGAGAETNFHEICAGAFQNNANSPTSGAQITFAITGVGRIQDVGSDERCSTTAAAAVASTLTVVADSSGIARACLFSQQGGRTTVTASSGTPAQTDTGTKDWIVEANHVRRLTIHLKHASRGGDALLVSGRLALTEGGFEGCIARRKVAVQRRVKRRWVTEKRAKTSSKGRYHVEISDREGTYRVRAKSETIKESTHVLHLCGEAVAARRHGHRA